MASLYSDENTRLKHPKYFLELRPWRASSSFDLSKKSSLPAPFYIGKNDRELVRRNHGLLTLVIVNSGALVVCIADI